MRRLLALCLLLTLAACTQPEAMVDMAPEPVPEAGLALEEAPAMSPKVNKCAPGEGDGIGGTGCAID
jgi:hypothetical protein